MSDLRTAAQQALEALENSRVFVTTREKIKHPEGTEWYDERITALRAALAQQEKEQADYPEEKLQAVAEYISDKYHVWYGVAARDIEEVLRQSVSCGLVSNPPRREAEQEPVAWIQPDHLQKARQAPFLCRVEPTKRMSDFVPIYTAPPRREWQSLTPDAVFASDEIMSANASLGLRIDQLMDLAHAIEQACKERNT